MADEIRFEHRMSDTDALLWNVEKDPSLRSTVTAVMILDRVLPRDALIQRFERVSRVVPRLRQRVRANPMSVAPPRWEVDPHFDLHFHLWWVKAPGKGTVRDLMSIAEPVAMTAPTSCGERPWPASTAGRKGSITPTAENWAA